MPAKERYLAQAAIDALALAAGLLLATWGRYEFSFPPGKLADALKLMPLAMVAQLLCGWAAGLYAGRWRFGGFEEVSALARSVAVATAIVALCNRYAFDRLIPVSASLFGGVIGLVLSAGARYGWRWVIERRLRPDADSAQRVIVFGAGEGGHQIITAMMRNPDSSFVPVAILDDDRAKQNLRLMGVPVLGGRNRLVEVAEASQASALVIAIPSAGSSLIREITELSREAGIEVMVLPPVSELIGTPIRISDIRPLSESDLLGRREIDTDIDAIASYLTGRRVLVTGAGGSIGSELCRQIYRFAPAELIMLERDESALHAVQLSIEGRAMLDSRNLAVCDIRDRERLDRVFDEHRPEVVFHAAALKHLPLLEMHPAEAVKTNCLGTQNLLEAAAAHGVSRFVNVSTDKAADPTSVLGYTKRLAEQLTAATAAKTEGTYLSVRFGNVLGSRGSVLTAFRAQIESGGPVTVTHPDVTRYFMTIEEAVQLVIQAGAVGRDGEALVLDMGVPVLIDQVARRLIDQADRPIEIVYTGLRPGEKLHEVLLGEAEDDSRPAHPLISQVPVPPLSIDDVLAIDLLADDERIVAELRGLCCEDRTGASASGQLSD